jgi:Dna[CI] antecedent, DciA
MERIADDVRLALRRFGPAEHMADIVRCWPTTVGGDIARNAWPARMSRDGTLHVAASSSAWAFELTQLEPTIRGRLRETLGGSAPKRLRFAPGPLPERGIEVGSAGRLAPPKPASTERARAAEIAAEIADPDLRDLVARAAAASLTSARSGRSL